MARRALQEAPPKLYYKGYIQTVSVSTVIAMIVIKWFFRIAFCAVILYLLVGVVTYWLNKPVEAPDIDKAPWAIQTYSNDEMRVPSRVYYAEDVKSLEDGTPVIKNYWSFDGKKYKRHRGEKEFPETDYGSIDLIRRVGQ